MKILVSGGAGFLGSHLCKALVDAGHYVFSVDNLIGGDEKNLPEGVHNFRYDTADFEAINTLISIEKPDIVYHCACIACEGFSVFSPAFITQNTFQNTIGILSSSINNGVKRFIYCSSMSRYGGQRTPFTEDMEPKPEDPYAVGKVASEQVIKMLSETHGFEYAIAVPHNIIGINQKYDDPFRNVVSIFINRMLQGKPPIIYGDGSQKRSFSFVEDCIESLVRMIDCKSGEVYNIGHDEIDMQATAVKEIADIIAEEIGFKGEYIYMPDRPREVKEAFCSSDKIRRDFGFECKGNLRNEIKKMIADIKEKGTKEFDYKYTIEINNDKTPKTWSKKLI